MADLQVGNVGSVIRRTVKDQDGTAIDLSTASPKQFLIRRADGSVVTKSVSFTNSGTDGKVQYTTVAGDLNTPGLYRLQGKFTVGASTYYTNIDTFQVLANLG
jgi:hypothetical protein